MAVRPYLVSLAIGILVGVVYATMKVRSPAPPVVALVGLLGMLAGEKLVPWVRGVVAARTVSGTTPHSAPAASGELVNEERDDLPSQLRREAKLG